MVAPQLKVNLKEITAAFGCRGGYFFLLLYIETKIVTMLAMSMRS